MDPQTVVSFSKDELDRESLTSRTGSDVLDSGTCREVIDSENVLAIKTVQEPSSVQTPGDSQSLHITEHEKPGQEDLASKEAHQEQTQEIDACVVTDTDTVEKKECLISTVVELDAGTGSPPHTDDVCDADSLKVRYVDSTLSTVTKENTCNGTSATNISIHELDNSQDMQKAIAVKLMSDVIDIKTNLGGEPFESHECNTISNCDAAHNESSFVEECPDTQDLNDDPNSVANMKLLDKSEDIHNASDVEAVVGVKIEADELKDSKEVRINSIDTYSPVDNENGHSELPVGRATYEDYEEISNETDAEICAEEISELPEVNVTQSKSDFMIGEEGLIGESNCTIAIQESIKQVGEGKNDVSNNKCFFTSKDLEESNSTMQEETSLAQTAVEEISSLAQLHHEHSVDGNSSVDSTAGSGWKLQEAAAQTLHEDANASGGEDSASSSTPVLLVPPQRKKIDLHHQFVREIVKIQHDRGQVDKQTQAHQTQLGSKYLENKDNNVRPQRHARNDIAQNNLQKTNLSAIEQHLHPNWKDGAGKSSQSPKNVHTLNKNELRKSISSHGEDSIKGIGRSRISKQPSLSIYRPPVARDSNLEEQNVISSPESSTSSVSESQFPTFGLHDAAKDEGSLKVVRNAHGERHVHYMQSQSESTAPGMGIKVTFDTQKKQRHIEFKDVMSNHAGDAKVIDQSDQAVVSQSVSGSRNVDAGSSQSPNTIGAFQFGTVVINSKEQGRINIPECVVKQGRPRDKSRYNEGGYGKPKGIGTSSGKKKREQRMKTREPDGDKKFLVLPDACDSFDSNQNVDNESENMGREHTTNRQEVPTMSQCDLSFKVPKQSAPETGVSTFEWSALYSTPMTEKWGDVVDDCPDVYDNVLSTEDGENDKTPAQNEPLVEEVSNTQNNNVNKISRSRSGKYSGIKQKVKVETEGTYDSPNHESPSRKSVWERLGQQNDYKGSILGPPPKVLEKSSIHLDVNHRSPSMSQNIGPYAPNNDGPEVPVHAYTDVRQKKSKRELYGQRRAF